LARRLIPVTEQYPESCGGTFDTTVLGTLLSIMTLSGNAYAIHGTNQPGSIGHFVSYGCIRMFNKDIRDLYSRVSVGTRVVVE
jgi:lipoprotein-anchoring transpeptidase ErfK/SrfK